MRLMPTVLLCVIIGLTAEITVAQTPAGQELQIYVVDVEGGGATLVVSPSGESLLIDTGNGGDAAPRDAGRIMEAINDAGLDHLDHLIITHYHGDHFGGAATLATMIPIKNLYDNGLFDGMPNQPDKSYLELKCDKRTVIKPGDRIELNQGDKKQQLSLLCLGTRQQLEALAEMVHATKSPL